MIMLLITSIIFVYYYLYGHFYQDSKPNEEEIVDVWLPTLKDYLYLSLYTYIYIYIYIM